MKINYGSRARLGVLLPSGNQAAEPQFNAMRPAGVALHTSTPEGLGEHIRSETAKWGAVIREIGLKIE